jgi:hypothetical protein
LQKEGGHPFVAPSPIPLPTKNNDNASSSPLPRALTIDEIKEYVQLFAAAENAIFRAGFDGREDPPRMGISRTSFCRPTPMPPDHTRGEQAVSCQLYS